MGSDLLESLAAELRESWRPPRSETVDEWAERVLILPPGGSSIPGRVSFDWTPYVREPLRMAADPDVEEVTLCWSTQVGKTMAAIVVALHSVAARQRPALHVMPREDDGKAISVERYQPIIRSSPDLATLLDPAKKKEMKADQIMLRGVPLNFVGARSPASLASRPKAVAVVDEVDKYPAWSGDEADPIELVRERLRTFVGDRVLFITSTPTTEHGYVWSSLKRSDERRFWLPCPHCGEYQALVMGGKEPGTAGVKWPADVRDPERIADGRLAWYECGECGGRIEDGHKQEMLRQGRWVPRGGRVVGGEVAGGHPRRSVGYHLWAAYSPWLTFSDIAAKFLSCFGKDGRAVPQKLQNFVNSWTAEPWQEARHTLSIPAVKRREAPCEIGVVPREARSELVCTADVQASEGRTYLYYVVRAYGDDGRSWLVRAGRAESWPQFHDVLRARYPHGDSHAEMRFCLVDSGFRTSEVYEFCLETGAWAVKGASVRTTSQIKRSTGEMGSDQIELLVIDTTYFKDKLHRLVREEDRWQIPPGLPEEYFAHMTAEQKVQVVDKRTGQLSFVWKCIPDGSPNHFFDCEVYQVAAAELLELEYRGPSEEARPKPHRVTQVPGMGRRRVFS